MPDRLKIFKEITPFEFVLFDHNPEKITVTRAQAQSGRSQPSAKGGSPGAGATAGALGALFHGTDPMTITITKARLIGPECKVMCDNLMGWLSPASGIFGAILAAIGLNTSAPPVVIVQWGPPMAGFMVRAQMTKANITYLRVSSEGIPLHATCDLTLKEVPSPLSLTNPTSGGRPGRSRHVMVADENLMSVSTAAFGTPNAWRLIADVNGIDDPNSVKPGDVIYLPAPEELRELAETTR
ncbi:MAG: hypothetical protein K0S92_2001 [Desertimonas sp.]|jgi:nucleoid-associated protein YgaU|nr:hypothetical protein [Desertimonas sp.]